MIFPDFKVFSLSLFSQKKNQGFTFIELMVILVIFSLFMMIVVSSISRARSSGRDNQVRADKQNLKLALARAAQFTSGGKYPGTANTWYCLKTTGTSCFVGAGTVSSSVTNVITPYLAGGVYPSPPGSTVGERRYDAYLYNPNWAPAYDPFGVGGPILVWPSERTLVSQSADCNGYVYFESGAISGSGVNVYYCHERLQQ